MTERERLTEHLGDGVRYDNGEYIITCYPKNKNLNPVDKLAAKLCELEDKIENGTLIELPCKVGDMVWLVVTEANRIEKLEVESIAIGKYCDTIAFTDDTFFTIWDKDYSVYYKFVFPTKEEAEKALAERKQK